MSDKKMEFIDDIMKQLKRSESLIETKNEHINTLYEMIEVLEQRIENNKLR